jgi:hypothetical protein
MTKFRWDQTAPMTGQRRKLSADEIKFRRLQSLCDVNASQVDAGRICRPLIARSNGNEIILN